jgi:hypothetical protein
LAQRGVLFFHSHHICVELFGKIANRIGGLVESLSVVFQAVVMEVAPSFF